MYYYIQNFKPKNSKQKTNSYW